MPGGGGGVGIEHERSTSKPVTNIRRPWFVIRSDMGEVKLATPRGSSTRCQ